MHTHSMWLDTNHQSIIWPSVRPTLLWLWCGTKVNLSRWNLMDLDTLGEESGGVLLLDPGHHHTAAALLPVHRGGHLPGGGELQAVHNPEDLVKVPACGCWVEERQFQPSVWANHKHSSAGKGDTLGILLIRVQHAVQVCHVTLGVGNDRVREPGGQVVVGDDVLDPTIMGLHLVTGQGNELHTPLVEFVAELLDPSELGGADGGVVSWVGEEDGPAVLDPAVEVNIALSGVGGEVWNNISKFKNLSRHGGLFEEVNQANISL